MKASDRPHASTLVDPRTPDLRLGDAVAYFVRRPSVIGLLTLLCGSVIARLWVAEFSRWDLLLAASLVGIHPMSEWLIHVGILHFRPRHYGRWTLDFAVARDHRAHHADPHDPKWWFIPLRSGVVGFLAVTTIAFGLLPPPLALTMMVAALGLGTTYEWIHYLCHSSWRPRSRWYKRLWRLHRLHHFKNENYWMGVTMHAADVLLGTLPEVDEVETSPTCRNLDGR
jgi:Fatty acid hydroxylase superfamily